MPAKKKKTNSYLTLYHGSDHVIRKPELSLGRPNNDYGRGFYCTTDFDLAGEWACRNGGDGIINKYRIDISRLKLLNLCSNEYTVLDWIAILLNNRKIYPESDVERAAMDYLEKHFLIDVRSADIIEGYRADDSYFSYAESFIGNSMSVRKLKEAMQLGNLGIQFALVSKKAFTQLEFECAYNASKSEYYPQFIERDRKAREGLGSIRSIDNIKKDLFILDIIRQEVMSDDPRIR